MKSYKKKPEIFKVYTYEEVIEYGKSQENYNKFIFEIDNKFICYVDLFNQSITFHGGGIHWFSENHYLIISPDYTPKVLLIELFKLLYEEA